MIREMIGVRTIASAFMPNRRRRKRGMMSGVSAMGLMAGAGIAYMAMRKRNNQDSEDDNE